MTRHSRAQPADPAPSPGPRDDTAPFPQPTPAPTGQGDPDGERACGKVIALLGYVSCSGTWRRAGGPCCPPLTRSEGITVAAGACRACCTNVGELGACPLCPGDHHQASCWPTRAPPATLSGWRVQHPLWGAQGSPMSGVAEAMVGTGLVSHLIVPRGTFCCSGQMAR